MATTALAVLSASVFGGNKNLKEEGGGKEEVLQRFDRQAESKISVDTDVILTIHGNQYDISCWAAAHPGGYSIVKRFHMKDATRAFDAVGHSDAAYALLKNFAISPTAHSQHTSSHHMKATKTFSSPSTAKIQTISRWRSKLFTREDPLGLHKSMGIFSLVHFAYRYAQAIFGDPSAGLGTRMGAGPGVSAIVCVIPHAILSVSSLIFHTVPRERVVGKPMIWKEFRAHSIVFGLRSVLTTVFAWMAIYNDNDPKWRQCAVLLSCLTVLAANAGADAATKKLCQNSLESTTATMPYWHGCSVETQRRFKSFYALCQFLATLACMTVSNPVWPLVVLLPIQLAALLMTLVRKGLISTRSYHMAYTASLCMPFVVGVRHLLFMKTPDFAGLSLLGWIMYQLRRRGVSKYVLWIPVVVLRITLGDSWINWSVW